MEDAVRRLIPVTGSMASFKLLFIVQIFFQTTSLNTIGTNTNPSLQDELVESGRQHAKAFHDVMTALIQIRRRYLDKLRYYFCYSFTVQC